jgi:hypothetical protein
MEDAIGPARMPLSPEAAAPITPPVLIYGSLDLKLVARLSRKKGKGRANDFVQRARPPALEPAWGKGVCGRPAKDPFGKQKQIAEGAGASTFR